MGAKEHREKSVTLLTGIDSRAQMAMAVILPSKSVNRYTLTEFKRHS